MDNYTRARRMVLGSPSVYDAVAICAFFVGVSVQQASSTGCTQHSIKSSQSLSAPSLSLESLSHAALFLELEAERKKCFALEQRVRELEDQTMLGFKESLQSEVDSVVASKAILKVLSFSTWSRFA